MPTPPGFVSPSTPGSATAIGVEQLVAVLHTKGAELAEVLTMARTQLQDAIPMTLDSVLAVDNLLHLNGLVPTKN